VTEGAPNSAGVDADRMSRLSPERRALLARLLEAADNGTAGPSSPAERALVEIWQDVLRVEHVGVQDSFFALGGDSITSILVSVRAAAVGLRVTSRQVLEEETVAQLAAVAGRGPADEEATDVALGVVVLTPVQQWFFEQHLPEPEHWDQAMYAELAPGTDPAFLAAALSSVVTRHAVLRSRFVFSGDRWQHEVLDSASAPALSVVELGDVANDARAEVIRTSMDAAARRLDLAEGRLVTAVLFRSDRPDRDRILLLVHHLVVDGVSMRVLVEDLAHAWQRLARGDQPDFPPRTASYRTWAAALARQAGRPEVSGQLDHWRSVPSAAAASSAIHPADRLVAPFGTVGRSRTVVAEVDEPTVAALRRHRNGARLRQSLLAGLLLAWRDVTGRDALQVDIEGHGREPLAEPIDVSRTVGWFTSVYPVTLALSDEDDVTTAVETVRRQLDLVPDNGIGYGLLRYFDVAGAELADLPQSQVSFNYLGWFEPGVGAAELVGPPLPLPAAVQSPAATRRYALEVVVTGVLGRLRIELTYGVDHHRDRDIEDLLGEYVAVLQAMSRPRSLGAGTDEHGWPESIADRITVRR
jgi:non-ribosomal peptide synthase protein (TIGR01720 family)